MMVLEKGQYSSSRYEVNFYRYTSDMLPINPALLTKGGRDDSRDEKKGDQMTCHHAYNVVEIDERTTSL